jgi:hypothetical protein
MPTPFFGVTNELRTRNFLRGFILAAVIIAACLCPLSAFAQSCPGTTSWNGGTGSWEASGNWSSGVPGATSNTCINVANSTVNTTATSGDTTLNLDINLSTDILNIQNTLTIQSAGNILNNGVINLSAGLNNAELVISGSTTLSGTGTVTMSNNTSNYIWGGPTLTNQTLTNHETIQGAGVIGNGTLTLVNSGTIDANQSTQLVFDPNGTTNSGTLEATAGSVLFITGSSVANGGGLIQANGATVELDNVSITGGTLTTSSGGVIESLDGVGGTSTPTLTGLTITSGSTVDIPNSDILTLGAGTITNKGTINLQSSGSNTFLAINGAVTLASTGKVIMSANGNNYILGSGTLTNQNTIEGEGNIGDGQIGLVNTGSILANETGTHTPSILYIDTGAAGFSNSSGTKNGILNVSAKNTIIIEGGPFTNFSAGTLTGGTYMVTGKLEFAAGTGLVTNDAAITLTGATAEILNTSDSTNALTQFADNGVKGSFTVNALTFTDANVFTNSGTLAVGPGGKFNDTTELANFNSTSGTLSNGTYILTGTGQFQFTNQSGGTNIVINDANITLAGVDTTKFSIIDQNGANALANFATNEGSFTLTSDRQFTTGGNLSNAGTVTVMKSTGTGTTELIVNGSYTQTNGTTTVDGVLSTSTGINVSGGFIYGNAAGVTNGKQGTLVGNFDLTGGTLNPGDGLKKIGDLNITGTYTESGAGILNIDLDGITSGKFDVLNISGAATLGGTLNVDALTGFTPTVGQQFDILNYVSETGSFSTVDCTFSNGDRCSIAYNSTGAVLTIDAPAAPAQRTVSASPAKRVSRGLVASTPASTQLSAAITSRVTCFAARLLGLTSCGASGVNRGEHQLAPVGAGSGTVHNNVMVASRSISAARAGASHESSASALAMARLYACAYLPSSVAHTVGCN